MGSWKKIGRGFKKAWKVARGPASSVLHGAGSVVKTLYKDGKSGIVGLEKQGFSLTKDLLDAPQKLFGQFSSNFALPIGLALGAIGVAYVALK